MCNECRSSGTCYDPIQRLPESNSPNAFHTAFEGLIALFAAQPERFSVHRVRGVALPDAIARVSSEHVDLSQLLIGFRKKHYRLTLTEITSGTDLPTSESKVARIDREQTNVSQLALPGIHAGLYEAKLSDGDPSENTWVLFVDPRSYNEVNSEFLRFSNQMETWGDDVLPSLKDSYRRACLVYLDQQIRSQNDKRIQH